MVAATMAWTMMTGLILMEKWQGQEFTLFPLPNTKDRLLPWGYFSPKAWDYKSSFSCSPSIRQIRLVVFPQQRGAVSTPVLPGRELQSHDGWCPCQDSLSPG
jgi:hypothetical protein